MKEIVKGLLVREGIIIGENFEDIPLTLYGMLVFNGCTANIHTCIYLQIEGSNFEKSHPIIGIVVMCLALINVSIYFPQASKSINNKVKIEKIKTILKN